MIHANHQIGEHFNIQFVWQLPNKEDFSSKGDFIRVIMKADVLDTDPTADKYIVRLSELVAGRQESAHGEPRQPAELTKEYWAMVGRIVGTKIIIAYEAEDGRPLHLRLATLTGEHTFFHRFEE